jgi:hypothetical protein
MADFTISEGGILAGYSGSGGAVSVPSTVTKIGRGAFRNMPVSAVTLPSATIEIGAEAFAGCSQLRSITIPTTQVYVAADAFTGTQVLSAPSNLQIANSVIQWAAPTNAPRSISSYNAYINGTQRTTSTTSISTSHLVKGVTNTIQVAAVDASGEGVRSSVMSYAYSGNGWNAAGTIAIPADYITAYGNRIHVRNGTTGEVSNYTVTRTHLGEITATTGHTGQSIAASATGDRLVVSESAAVKIYETADNSSFSITGLAGQANAEVAISADGQTVALGCPADDGCVYIYQYYNSQWTLMKTLYGTSGSSEGFGCSVALSADGQTIAVGAKYALGTGAVRIFSGRMWASQKNIYGETGSNENFGYSLALSRDGATLVVGSPCRGTPNIPGAAHAGHGAATVWKLQSGNWAKQATFYGEADEQLGSSVSMNAMGSTVATVGAGGYGTVRVYADNNGSWPQVFSQAGSSGQTVRTIALNVLGDCLYYGGSAVSIYHYRTDALEFSPSVSTLLSAAVVQNATQAEVAAENFAEDVEALRTYTGTQLTAEGANRFAATLPGSGAQASMATLLIAGNLLDESQNTLKSLLQTACRSVVDMSANTYISVQSSYIPKIVSSAGADNHLAGYSPSPLYVYFPSGTSVTVDPSYANVTYALTPGTSYTFGSTTISYRRKSELQQLLLSLPGADSLRSPFSALFSAAAINWRRQNIYGALLGTTSATLLECATAIKEQTLSHPETYSNFTTLAWLSMDMVLSVDTTTQNVGKMLLRTSVPLARGILRIAAFSDGGADADMDRIPSGYFKGTADGSIAFPPKIMLTRSTGLTRIDANAFDTSVSAISINDQTYTVENGNITLSYGTTRVWSITVAGVDILLPGAPAIAPTNGRIDIPTSVAYIPDNYFANATATTANFGLCSSTDVQTIGKDAFPVDIKIRVNNSSGYLTYTAYNLKGGATRYSGIFYSDFEKAPVAKWDMSSLNTDNVVRIPPGAVTKSIAITPKANSQVVIPQEMTTDRFLWDNKDMQLSLRYISVYRNNTVKYGDLTYSSYAETLLRQGERLIGAVKQDASSAPIKLLMLYSLSYKPISFNDPTGYITEKYETEIPFSSIPAFVKNNKNLAVSIPHSSNYKALTLTGAGGGWSTTPYDLVQEDYWNTTLYDHPVHYTFTHNDLADEQVFYYGNLAWTNSSSASALRIKSVLSTVDTAGEVFLMPNAFSLYPYMFGESANAVRAIRSYRPSMSYTIGYTTYSFPGVKITSSIPAFVFKYCKNLQAHDFAFQSSIGESAFEGCQSLTNGTFSLTDTSFTFGKNAFKDCTALSAVSIASTGSVTIQESAFGGCSSVSSVSVDCSGAVSIDTSTFSSCKAIETISLKSRNTLTIGSSVFADCSGATSLTIDCSGSVSIGASAFSGCSGITSVTINGSSVSINATAFTGCTAVQTIVVNGLTSSISFATMTGLRTVQLSTGATLQLGSMAGLTALTSVSITGSSTVSFSGTQFNGCTALQTISIANPIVSVAAADLLGCSALSTVSLNLNSSASCVLPSLANITTLTSLQITGTGAITLPETFCNGCTGLRTVSFAAGTLTSPSNGNLFSGCSALETLTLSATSNPSANVFRVGSVLAGLKDLSITGAITVGGDPFWANSVLRSVTIRGTRSGSLGTLPVGTIQTVNVNHDASQNFVAYQYANYTALTSMNLTPLVDISEGAFFGCTSMTSFNFDQTRSIDDWAFAKTGLSGEVVIPATTTYLGDFYFVGCPNLKKITYLCNVTMFNDPTRFDTSHWGDIIYNNSTNPYAIEGVATLAIDPSSDISFAYTANSSTTTLNATSSVFKKNFNASAYLARKTNLNDLLIGLGDYYSTDTSGNYLYDNSGAYVLDSAGKIQLDASGNPTKNTSNPYWRRVSHVEAISNFITRIKYLAQTCEGKYDIVSSLNSVPGWTGTRFSTLDTDVRGILSAADYAIYQNKFYPTLATYYKNALEANQKIFTSVSGDTVVSIPVGYTIPITQFSLNMPQSNIMSIADSSSVANLVGGKIVLQWQNPSFLFNEKSLLDISGTASLTLSDVVSANVANVLLWSYQNIESLSNYNSVGLSFNNKLTSIKAIDNKNKAVIDISSIAVTIYEFGMVNIDNSVVNITCTGATICNNAFNTWSEGTTLNFDSLYDPNVGINIFKGSDTFTVNSKNFLMNAPELHLVDVKDITLDNIPSLIEEVTGISAELTTKVEIGTYMPETTATFTPAYAYVKFQALPTLKMYILMQKPEDWLWIHSNKYDSGGTIIETGSAISAATGGLTSTFAPDTFNMYGYKFTRTTSRDASRSLNDVTVVAPISTDSGVKESAFNGSESGQWYNILGELAMSIGVTVLVTILTAGFGAAIGTATVLARVAIAVVGTALEVGATLGTRVVSQGVTTGSFTLGNTNSWVFILEITLSLIGLAAVSKLIKPLKNTLSKFSAQSSTLSRTVKAASTKTETVVEFVDPALGNKLKDALQRVNAVAGDVAKPVNVADEVATTSRLSNIADIRVNPRPDIRPAVKYTPGSSVSFTHMGGLPAKSSASKIQLGHLAQVAEKAPSIATVTRRLDTLMMPLERGAVIADEFVTELASVTKAATDNYAGIAKAAIQHSKAGMQGAISNTIVGTFVKGSKSVEKILQPSVAGKFDNVVETLTRMKPSTSKSKEFVERMSKGKDAHFVNNVPTQIRRRDGDEGFAFLQEVFLADLIFMSYFKNDFSDAAITKQIINAYKTAIPQIDVNNTFSTITLPQIAAYNSQALIPTVGALSGFGKNITYEESYLDSFFQATNSARPPYILSVAGKPSFETDTKKAMFSALNYATQGTNYEHPIIDRDVNGLPCQTITAANALLTNAQYLWKGIGLGSPTSWSGRARNNNSPTSPTSYSNVILTATDDLRSELYLGNRIVNYSTTRQESPNMVYNGAINMTVVIPAPITAIPDYAFNGTDGLFGTIPLTITNTYINPGVTSIGKQAFYRSTMEMITYPSSATIGERAFANTNLKNIITISPNQGVSTYTGIDNVEVSLKVKFGTQLIGTKSAVMVSNFDSLQVTRDGVVLQTITSGTGRWAYIQGPSEISIPNVGVDVWNPNNAWKTSRNTLTINPLEISSLRITGGSGFGDFPIFVDTQYNYDVFDASKSRWQLPNGDLVSASPLIDVDGINYPARVNEVVDDFSKWYSDSKKYQLKPEFNGYFLSTLTSSITLKGNEIVNIGYGTTSVTVPTARTALAETSIADHAFEGSATLEYVEFPDNCVSIGASAFQGCKGLKKPVCLPDTVRSIGANAFADSGVCCVVIPSSVVEIGANAFPTACSIILQANESGKVSTAVGALADQLKATNTVFVPSAAVLEEVLPILGGIPLRVDRAPLQPIGVGVKALPNGLVVAWSAANSVVSSPAVSHTVLCVSRSGEIATHANVSSPFLLSDLNAGEEYSVSVIAKNTVGESAPTSVQATPSA